MPRTSGNLPTPFWYFGAKATIARTIVNYLPKDGKTYVEPYCGSASLFFYKPTIHEVEVLNDLNQDIVNVFRCLQKRETYEELRFRLLGTPYSLAEFKRALTIRKSQNSSLVDRAWAYFVTQNQGYAGKASGWGRASIANDGINNKTEVWIKRLGFLDSWRWRLMHVHLDCKDALWIIKTWDSKNTIFYLDPPYLVETRSFDEDYDVEVSEHHHEKLVDTLLSVKGKVILSGYNNQIYYPLEADGWKKVCIKVRCSSKNHMRNRSELFKSKLKQSKDGKENRYEYLWIKS